LLLLHSSAVDVVALLQNFSHGKPICVLPPFFVVFIKMEDDVFRHISFQGTVLRAVTLEN
jgi:hypothetical protein